MRPPAHTVRMRSNLLPSLISFLLALSIPIAAHTDSFRCGRKLIRTGDTTADVLRVCGQPQARDRGQAEVRSHGVGTKQTVERWHYRRSGRSLPRIVNIHRGRVVSIEVGSR